MSQNNRFLISLLIPLLMIAVALLVTSCSNQPTAKDGYNFERPQFVLQNPRVSIVTYPSLAALRASAPLRAHRVNNQFEAYAIVNPVINTCEIHIVAPHQSGSYRPELYGHELMHCLYGDFHPSQNDR